MNKKDNCDLFSQHSHGKKLTPGARNHTVENAKALPFVSQLQ